MSMSVVKPFEWGWGGGRRGRGRGTGYGYFLEQYDYNWSDLFELVQHLK